MSSKRILRSVLVAVVAAGLVVGPAGAAVAAPDRGEGARAGWGVALGEWVEVVWGWLLGEGVGTDHRGENGGTSKVRSLTAADTNNGQMDPNG